MAFTHDPVMHIIRSWNLTPIIESNDDAFGTFASDYVNTWLETHGMMPQFCACGSGEPLTGCCRIKQQKYIQLIILPCLLKGLFVQLRISSSKLYGLVVCCTQHNDVRNYVMNSPNCLFLPLVDDYANQFAWPGMFSYEIVGSVHFGKGLMRFLLRTIR